MVNNPYFIPVIQIRLSWPEKSLSIQPGKGSCCIARAREKTGKEQKYSEKHLVHDGKREVVEGSRGREMRKSVKERIEEKGREDRFVTCLEKGPNTG